MERRAEIIRERVYSGMIWVGSFDDREYFADTIFKFLAGLLFGLDFFFSLLLSGTEDGGKEAGFPILRHGCGSPGVKVLRASPGCLTVSFLCSLAGTAMSFFSYSSMLAAIPQTCKVLSVTSRA